MAKIGTAHIEIKPVLDEASLERICERLEVAIAKAIENGMAAAANVTNVYVQEPVKIEGSTADLARAVRRSTGGRA